MNNDLRIVRKFFAFVPRSYLEGKAAAAMPATAARVLAAIESGSFDADFSARTFTLDRIARLTGMSKSSIVHGRDWLVNAGILTYAGYPTRAYAICIEPARWRTPNIIRKRQSDLLRQSLNFLTKNRHLLSVQTKNADSPVPFQREDVGKNFSLLRQTKNADSPPDLSPG